MSSSPEQLLYLKEQFHDIEEFSHFVKEWGLDYRQLDRGEFKAKALQINAGSALITHVNYNRHLDQNGSAPPGFRTIALYSNQSSNRVVWRNREIGPNDLMLFPPDGELSAVAWPGFHVFTVSLTESLLSHVSQISGLPGYEDLTKGKEAVTGSGTAMRDLRRLIHQISRMADQNGKREDSDELYYRLEYELPKMILSILDSAQSSRKNLSRRRAHTLSRSKEIIRACADEPLTVRDLSQMVGVTERALEYAFKDNYGVSTKSYLQATRLNAVRCELRNARPHSTKVIDVANRWGFWHMGQFARDYRKLFNELPSTTRNKSHDYGFSDF